MEEGPVNRYQPRVRFDVWELPPGASEGCHTCGVDHGLDTTGIEPLRLVLLFGKPWTGPS